MLGIETRGTGQLRRVANFLLGWRNAEETSATRRSWLRTGNQRDLADVEGREALKNHGPPS